VILVDTNVFVDLWTREPAWADWSEEALVRAAEAGPLGVNPIIYGELCFRRSAGARAMIARGGAGERYQEAIGAFVDEYRFPARSFNTPTAAAVSAWSQG
jgi:predicted nucleic acid-binding protein